MKCTWANIVGSINLKSKKGMKYENTKTNLWEMVQDHVKF
jgi:hypothetical protein